MQNPDTVNLKVPASAPLYDVAVAAKRPDSERAVSRKRREFAPYLALLVFCLALLWPLVRGRALYWGDLIVYFEPMADYARHELRQGRVPLWNPYVLGGQPYLGNPQMGVFYPATLLLLVLPSWAALSVALFVHLWLCGAWMFAYLCRWTQHRSSALAGGMVYMGSACLLARLQFPPMIYSAAYLPLILLLIDRQLARPTWRTGLLLALAFGLMVLAAHTQMAYFETLLGALYLAARLLREHKRIAFHDGAARRRWLVRRAAPFLLSALSGTWLCAVQVVPAAQLLKESPREAMTAEQANRFFLEARQLLTLLWPHFVGHPATGDYHAAGNAWEPALFIGWLPLVFIGIALTRWKQARVRFWTVGFMLGIWLAFGIKGGLFPIAFALVPGLSKFHDPARFLYFATLGFAALTAFGMDLWQDKRSKNRTAISAAVLVLIAAPMIWFGQEWNPTTAPAALSHKPAVLSALSSQGAFPTQEQGRIYLPTYRVLWNRYISYYDYGLNDVRTLAAFQDTLMPNRGMKWSVESLAGYEPVPLYAPFAVEGEAGVALERGEPNAARLMAMMNANTLLMPVGMRVTDPRFAPVTAGQSAGGMRAWHNRDAIPRVWLVSRTRRVEGRMRVLAVLTAPDFAPEQEAVLSFGANDALAGQFGALESSCPGEYPFHFAPVRMQTNAPGTVHIAADAGERPAFLVVSMMAYPGWQATVDGRPQPLVRTDGALMGVAVPAGRHEITLHYAPGAYRTGLYLTLLACGVFGVGAGYGLMRGGRNVKATRRMS